MINAKHLTEEDVHNLFVEHYADLVAFAAKFVAIEQGEDLVQDVFLQLLKKCGSLSISGTLEKYVYRSIKNKYLDFAKTKNVHHRYIDNVLQLGLDELSYYDPSKQQSLLLNNSDRALYDAIENLPDKCKEVIKAKYLSGKKNIQISQELGISTRTVETHVYKAMKQLKVVLRNVSMLFSFFITFYS